LRTPIQAGGNVVGAVERVGDAHPGHTLYAERNKNSLSSRPTEQ
jgi:hypothetical protein